MTNPEAYAGAESFWQPTELVSTLLSRSARDVVWHWISQKRFLGADNQPRSLSLCAYAESGFNCLIKEVNLHSSASVIGNELLRKGIVEQDDNDCLMLRRSAYVPGPSSFAGSSAKARTGRMVSPNDQSRRIMKRLSVCSAN